MVFSYPLRRKKIKVKLSDNLNLYFIQSKTILIVKNFVEFFKKGGDIIFFVEYRENTGIENCKKEIDLKFL